MKTRSSWFNCALRDDEALYWVIIGHYEAVEVGNWLYWVSRGHLCLYILHKVEIWTGVTDASLTHWLTTLKDSATQLLMKYKSGALVTQCWPNTMMNTPQKRFWSLETYYDQGVIVLAMGYTHEDWERQIADSSNSIKNKHMNICEEDLRFDITMYLQLAYGAFGRHCTNWGYLHKYLICLFCF